MSTTLEPETRIDPNQQSQTAAERVRHSFAACRVKFKWLGTSKSLSSEQKSQAAESFGAEGDSISAGKKLIDTKHEAFKALTSLKSQINKYWKDNSLPYPETGVRLIKHDRIDEFNSTLEDYREQLLAGVRLLDDHFAEIKEAASIRLGSLYDPSDYASSLVDEFQITWDFPSVEPPNYLQQLNPELYEEQARRVTQRFEHAVDLAEQAFIEELDRLVNHLSERLAGNEDGRPKIFRDSAVSNLTEFFERFRSLNVHSNAELDALVDRAEQVISGVNPQGLRDNDSQRQNLSNRMSGIQASLDQLLVDRPRRRILRPNQSSW